MTAPEPPPTLDACLAPVLACSGRIACAAAVAPEGCADVA